MEWKKTRLPIQTIFLFFLFAFVLFLFLPGMAFAGADLPDYQGVISPIDDQTFNLSTRNTGEAAQEQSYTYVLLLAEICPPAGEVGDCIFKARSTMYSVPPLEIGEDREHTTLVLECDIPGKNIRSYYIVVDADSTHVLDESNEDNNDASVRVMC